MKKYIILLLFFFAFSAAELCAQSKSEQLKKDKNRIENEIKNTQKLLEQTKKNKNASLEELSVLRKQISNREALITAMNVEIFSLEEELVLNENLLQNLDKKLEYMKADYARVVYLAYKNRKIGDKLTFLLASENFSQMFRRAKFYTAFADNVKHQVQLIEETKQEIEQKNQEILALKNEKVILLDGKEREIKSLEKDRNAKTKAAESLKKKEKQLAADLKAKQAKRKEIDVAIKRAIEAEIKAANEKKKAAKTGSKGTTAEKTAAKNVITLTPEEALISNSFVSNKGKLPWPVAKGAKISDFGNYPHPDVPSVMIENRGIDILVEAGTPVRSIFDGEVSGILDVMGTKVLMIRHGEYLSVYQNLTNITVKKGSKITTKQVIGNVAKMANSSTYELHFEIWKNSTYLNPSHWLSGR